MIIERATRRDAEEILRLQKLAYLSEAEIYADYDIPPLTQTLPEILAEIDTQVFLKATGGGAIVGTVRGRVEGVTGHIGRLAVHPDRQNEGIGTRLMTEVEALLGEASRFEIFTGHLSSRNLEMYARLGYEVFDTRPLDGIVNLTFMQKRGPRPLQDDQANREPPEPGADGIG